MKRVAAWVAALCAVPWTACGEVVWEKDLILLDATPPVKEVRGSFAFTNTGSVPVKIAKVQTKCGCTAAVPGRETVGPGERGEIGVTFTVGDRRGFYETPIFVRIDGPGGGEKTLRLRALIEEPLDCKPRLLFWKGDERGSVRTAEILLRGPLVGGTVSARASGPEWEVEVVRAEGGARLKVRSAGEGRGAGEIRVDAFSANERRSAVIRLKRF